MKKRLSNMTLYFFFLLTGSIACSRIELATSWADTYIHKEIDRYFDIDSMQSHFVKDSLKDDVQQIRSKIFPRLALEFQKILGEINQGGLTGEDISRFEHSLKEVFMDGLKVFDESAVVFVTKLRPEQMRNFKEEFTKKTEDLKNDSSTVAKAREKRFEKLTDQIEGWIGNLTSNQKVEIQKFCRENIFPVKEQIQNREKLMNDFIASFDNIESRKSFVHKLFLDYDNMRDPAYAKAIAEDQKNYFNLLASILNQMSVDQKKHLNETVLDRVEQLKKASQKKK